MLTKGLQLYSVYRPLMYKVKENLCTQLSLRNHIFFKMTDPAELDLFGNMLNPCPLSVRLTNIIHL